MSQRKRKFNSYLRGADFAKQTVPKPLGELYDDYGSRPNLNPISQMISPSDNPASFNGTRQQKVFFLTCRNSIFY